jgi:hypothetical protein
MASTTSKSFAHPDQLREPAKAHVAVVDVAGTTVARLTFEPGWRWSESIKPVVGTPTCQAHHLGAVVSGTLRVLGADGVETELKSGDAYDIQPGHDAWVVGSETFVAFEFEQPTAKGFAA